MGKAGPYRLMRRCGLMLYPTPGSMDPACAETSCLAVLEAFACGLPVVTTDRGALGETVGEAWHAGEGDRPARLATEALARTMARVVA